MYVVKRNGKFVFTERYNDPMTGKLKSASVTLEKNQRETKVYRNGRYYDFRACKTLPGRSKQNGNKIYVHKKRICHKCTR